MNKQNFKDKKGFTIIETLVAITILMISIAGPLTIAQKGFNAGIYAKDQVTASYLAQDAMEYIKNVRDNNVFASPSQDWLLGFDLDNRCKSLNNICKITTINTAPDNATGISQ